MAKFHVILRAALKAADKKQHPPAPHQLGLEWAPSLAIIHQIRVGLWIVAHVAETIDPNTRGHEPIVRPIEDYVEAWGEAGSPQAKVFDEALFARRRPLQYAASGSTIAIGSGSYVEAGVVEGDTPIMALARALAAATATLASGIIERVHFGLTTTTTRAIRVLEALQKARGTKGLIREFIALLDDKIMELAFRTALNEHAPRATAGVPRDVLWVGGKPLHWLVRTDRRYGLLGKIGPRWRFVEGERDEVLATVPDAYFDAAVRAISAQEPAEKRTSS
jgi:hypothetical protein